MLILIFRKFFIKNLFNKNLKKSLFYINKFLIKVFFKSKFKI